MDLGPLFASVAASVLTVGAGWLVARRYQKLGGGEAQERLNAIRKELDDAMTDKLELLQEDFAGCKTRLGEVEGTVKRLTRERLDLKQEVADLHAELRTLRTDRRGRTDRSDD